MMLTVDESTGPVTPSLKSELPQRRRSRPLFAIGVILTVLYIGAAVAYWWNGGQALLGLKPNEFGDFLAGTFAPLAFLWLVLGFLQQGDELRQSADALWLQGQELQNSVEQQRELVNVTREQLTFEAEMLRQQREEIQRNAQPVLRLIQGGNMGSGTDGTRIYDFHVLNHGKTCTDVNVDVIPPGRRFQKNLLNRGDKIDFRLELPFGEVEPFNVVIQYLGERLLSGSKIYKVSGANSRFRIDEEPEAADIPPAQ